MSDQGTEALSSINSRLGKLEGGQEATVRAVNDMATNVNRLIEKMDKSDDIAREADQRSKSAHHRIDEIKNNITWLWRTVVGVVITGGIGGAITLIWKFIGS